MQYDAGITHHVRAEVIEPALSQRILRLGRSPQRWFHHMTYIAAGRLFTGSNDAPETIAGPALVLLPPSEGESLAFAAGTHGTLIGISPEILAESIGDHAESPSLKLFAAAGSVLENLEPDLVGELEPLFRGIVSETQRESRASRMVVAAYARLIMISAWRAGGIEQSPAASAKEAGQILQRFRQMVEANFRNHQTITAYAEALGISTDRLHAICRRTLERSPIELVHDRLVQEAKLRLEKSARSIRDISDSLGFRDPTNFSHFFKRRTGMSPAEYRSLALRSYTSSEFQTSADYYEWP